MWPGAGCEDAKWSSAFSNDISETAGQIKTKLYLGLPWGGRKCIDFFFHF